MLDSELLLAIEDIFDKKHNALENRLSSKIDGVEISLNNKLDEVDGRLTNQIDGVDVRVTKIALALENLIEPRLKEIENCYLTTYSKYKDSAEKVDALEIDVAVIKSVVMEHGERLKTISA